MGVEKVSPTTLEIHSSTFITYLCFVFTFIFTPKKFIFCAIEHAISLYFNSLPRILLIFPSKMANTIRRFWYLKFLS